MAQSSIKDNFNLRKERHCYISAVLIRNAQVINEIQGQIDHEEFKRAVLAIPIATNDGNET